MAVNRSGELYGKGGPDALVGGTSGDLLIAGAGVDMLKGGNGPDLLDAFDGTGTTRRPAGTVRTSATRARAIRSSAADCSYR